MNTTDTVKAEAANTRRKLAYSVRIIVSNAHSWAEAGNTDEAARCYRDAANMYRRLANLATTTGQSDTYTERAERCEASAKRHTSPLTVEEMVAGMTHAQAADMILSMPESAIGSPLALALLDHIAKPAPKPAPTIADTIEPAGVAGRAAFDESLARSRRVAPHERREDVPLTPGASVVCTCGRTFATLDGLDTHREATELQRIDMAREAFRNAWHATFEAAGL